MNPLFYPSRKQIRAFERFMHKVAGEQRQHAISNTDHLREKVRAEARAFMARRTIPQEIKFEVLDYGLTDCDSD